MQRWCIGGSSCPKRSRRAPSGLSVGIASSRIGYRRAISRRAGRGVVIDDKDDICFGRDNIPRAVRHAASIGCNGLQKNANQLSLLKTGGSTSHDPW